MNARRVAIVPVLVGLLLLAGCPGPKKASVYSVTGKVTVEGKPLTGCVIGFSPVGTGSTASAAIGPDGSYKWSTDGGRQGALPGKYKVYFAPGQEMMQMMMKEQMMGGPPAGGVTEKQTAPKFKAPYPESYGDAATSPKEVTVEAKPNVFDIAI